MVLCPLQYVVNNDHVVLCPLQYVVNSSCIDNAQIYQDLIYRMVKLVRDFDKLDTNVSVLFFQKAAELAAMGVTGPEGHEMCRPEEVRFVFPHGLGSLLLLCFVQQLVCFFPLPFQFLIHTCQVLRF